MYEYCFDYSNIAIYIWSMEESTFCGRRKIFHKRFFTYWQIYVRNICYTLLYHVILAIHTNLLKVKYYYYFIRNYNVVSIYNTDDKQK